MDLVLRAFSIFWFIFLVTRVVGKRELSSMEPFDLILLVVIGDAVQQAMTQDDYSVTGAVVVVTTIALLQVFVSYIGFKVKPLGPILDGEPIIVLQDGKPIERNMARERITVEEIAEAGRMQNIGSLDDIAWAVLETDGEITIIPKQQRQ